MVHTLSKNASKSAKCLESANAARIRPEYGPLRSGFKCAPGPFIGISGKNAKRDTPGHTLCRPP